MKRELLIAEIERISERKEAAIPIYGKHLEVALEFSGISKGERERALEIIGGIRAGSESRISRMREFLKKLKESDKNDF